MKASGIGGQAVIEGIMMRNKEKYSIAVRKPDQEIEVIVKENKLLTEKHKWLNYPVIRGVFNFIDSLVTGISTISYSASFYDDPAEQKNTKVDEVGKAVFKDKLESVLMAVTVIFSVVFAIGLFMLLPYFISRLLAKVVVSKLLLNFLEGIIRLAIFMLYILAISRMNDIKRTFMYHGAEHKCINCIENGALLTPANVKNSSRFHKRCGTSFLFIVMFISIIFFIFIRVDNTALQLIIRLLLVPVIAGVSYEIIRWAGKNDNKYVDALSKPGMWFQHFTTKEPDMDMIEVAIEAVEAVFDWKAFLADYYQDTDNAKEEIKAKAAELALSSDLVIGANKSTRSINPDELSEEEQAKMSIAAVAAKSDKYDIENYSGPDETSDSSESTIHDNYNGESIVEDEDNGELPEGFEILEDDDTYDNALRSREDILKRNAAIYASILDDDDDVNAALMGNENADVEGMADNVSYGVSTDEEIEDDGVSVEEAESAFEIEEPEEINVKDSYVDDVPVFKERKTDKK